MGWLIGIIAFLVLIVVLLILPVKISASFSYLNETADYSLFASLGPVRVDVKKLLQKPRKERPPKPSSDEKKKLSFQDIENGLNMGVEALRYLRKKFTVYLFSFKARFALGDAADTGIATGAAYGSLYSVLGTIDRYFILKKHEVVITPVFQGVGLETEMQGIFGLRLIYGLGLIIKIRKGDVK